MELVGGRDLHPDVAAAQLSTCARARDWPVLAAQAARLPGCPDRNRPNGLTTVAVQHQPYSQPTARASDEHDQRDTLTDFQWDSTRFAVMLRESLPASASPLPNTGGAAPG